MEIDLHLLVDLSVLDGESDMAPSSPAAVRRLIDHSINLRQSDPQRSLMAAREAATLSISLPYGSVGCNDLRSEAHGALANALRVANRLPAADKAMAKAFAFHSRGSRSRPLTAQLEEWRTSLCQDCRLFAEARQAIDRALALRMEEDAPTPIGRALVQRALVVGLGGDPADGVRTLTRAMRYIDPETDPLLGHVVTHNLAWFLVDCGQPHDALCVLQSSPAVPPEFEVQDRWLRARILAASDGLDLAEHALSEVFEEFLRRQQPYDAALAGLELALCQPPASAVETLRAIRPIFSRLSIRRESMAAKLLEEGLKGGAVIPEIIRAVRTSPALFRRTTVYTSR